MLTKKLPNLSIYKLTKEQYNARVSSGDIDEYALYLTPKEEIDLSPYATKNEVDAKADSDHTHDDRYYTEEETDLKLSELETSISGLQAGLDINTNGISDLKTVIDGKADASHGTHVIYTVNAPKMDGTAYAGTATTVARSDHVHPTDTSRASQSDLTALQSTVDTVNESLATKSDVQLDGNFLSTLNIRKLTQEEYDQAMEEGTIDENALYLTPDEENDPITTSGDGSTYTATVNSITELTAGASFVMIPHVVSASTMPQVNVNNLGAKYIRRRLSNGTTTTVGGSSANWLGANKPIRLTYDGTYWIADIIRPNASDIYGILPIASGGTGASTAETARANLGLTTENWTFTLADGSTVTKVVYVG